MAHQIENYNVNIPSLNTSSTKEQDDFVHDKVRVSEYETSTILDNTKAELPSSEGQYHVVNNNIKIEEGISANDIKIIFDNGLLYCEHCEAYYEDYCIECGMLAHILTRNELNITDNRAQEELPNDILEIQHLFGQFGIFGQKIIPKGVKFGPFTGLCRTESAWKIKGGKFVVDKDRSRHLNWMQYINPARNTSERNLIVFQCEDYLYYRSTRQIQPDEELLVYFGEDFEYSLNENVELDFIPTTEQIVDVFACTFCCLGFSSKTYLAKHKTMCLVDSEFTQCPFCNIHFGEKKYLQHHLAYCCERNVRKGIPPMLSNEITTAVNRRKAGRHSQLYKCEHCNYKTKNKANLKDHTNKRHFKAKEYKCGICYIRFKTKTYLRLHVENTHIYGGGNKELAHSSCDYIEVEQSNSEGQPNRFKCSICGTERKQKISLTIHIKTKHLQEFDFKCDLCEFRTNRNNVLEIHIRTKHLKKFNFKCDSCKYRTNFKCNLTRHIRVKHLHTQNLEEISFQCYACEFGTRHKQSLERHIKVTHLKEFKFKCYACEFETRYKHSLERHTKLTHLKEFKFKCNSCEFKTGRKYCFKRHIKAKHGKNVLIEKSHEKNAVLIKLIFRK